MEKIISEPTDPGVYEEANNGIQQTNAIVLWDKLNPITLQPTEKKSRKGILCCTANIKGKIHLLLQSPNGLKTYDYSTTTISQIECRDEIVFRIQTRNSIYRLIICPDPDKTLSETLDETIARVKGIFEQDQE